MEFEIFKERIKSLATDINIELDDEKINKLYVYMNTLLEWNKNINLTAIVEPDDIIIKHFIDSLTINSFIDKNKKIIDVGTGAGFPGVPIGIYRDDLEVLLVDSLNKRINFLNTVCESLELNNIKTCHARVEELGHNKNSREIFDYATSRAVAPLNVLVEYMIPFVKVGGYCICMKGSNITDELNDAQKAIKVLGGTIEKVAEFCLPGTDVKRNIIVIKKETNTPGKYPRKPGTPSKEPIM